MTTEWSFAGALPEVWSFAVSFFAKYRGSGLELTLLDRFKHHVVQMFVEASESNHCLHFHPVSDPEMNSLHHYVA